MKPVTHELSLKIRTITETSVTSTIATTIHHTIQLIHTKTSVYVCVHTACAHMALKDT